MRWSGRCSSSRGPLICIIGKALELTGVRALPVYLIHWNRPDWCMSAVRSVQASVGVDPIVTVINNSPELSEDLRRSLPPEVRIVDMETNEGFAGGANAALRDWYASLPLAELAVIGAHDLHVDVGCLAALVAASRARSEYGVVGPILTQPF